MKSSIVFSYFVALIYVFNVLRGELNIEDDFAMKGFRAQKAISDNELYRKV